MRRSKVRYESFDGSRFITAGTFFFGLFCKNTRQKFGPGQITVHKSKFANRAKLRFRVGKHVFNSPLWCDEQVMNLARTYVTHYLRSIRAAELDEGVPPVAGS